MTIPSIILSIMLMQAGTTAPAQSVLQTLAKAGVQPAAEVVKPYIDPVGGLVVDVATEGSKSQKLVTITAANLDQHFQKVLLPMFKEGLFQATPGCAMAGKKIVCTLMTPTSLPRTLEFVVKDGKAFMSKLYWSPADEEGGDDDDDLPM